MDQYAQLAEKVFIGGTILFGISTLLLKSSWSALTGFLRNYPEARMPFKFCLRNMPEREKRLREESTSLIFATFFFAISTFASLGSIWQTAAYMLGVGNLAFFSQDYGVGKWSLMACVYALMLGFLSLAIFYGGEFKRVVKGYPPISGEKSISHTNSDDKSLEPPEPNKANPQNH